MLQKSLQKWKNCQAVLQRYLRLIGTKVIFLIVPNRIQQVRGLVRGVSQPENPKIPILHWQSPAWLVVSPHLLGVLGAITIITLNLCQAWIGKELTGHIQDDGRKILALQFTSKLLELFINASLASILWITVLEPLAIGKGLPFAALGTAFQFHDISFLWSKDFIAVCSARFKGKTNILSMIIVCTTLAVTVGPSSATLMIPTLNEWQAGKIPFALNVTENDLWPSFLSESTASNFLFSESSITRESADPTWDIIASNLLRFWGQATLGGVLALPESATIAGHSSVRTLNVRLRGPLTIYQPEYTATTIQIAVLADALNALRLLWFSQNSLRCSWAGLRLSTGVCAYRDIYWSMDAQQPVVYTACDRVAGGTIVSFPTMARGGAGPKANAVNITANVDFSRNSSYLEWVELEGPEFLRTSIGALISTNVFSDSQQSEFYACSIDAQWAAATARTSFLGLPYAISGEPPDFYEPLTSASRYRGKRVRVSPTWAARAFSFLLSNATEVSIFDHLLSTGALPPQSQKASKVEAVLAVAFVEQMARINSQASIQLDSSTTNDMLWSVENASKFLGSSSGHHALSVEVTALGFGYGLRTARGLSVSSTLALVTLLFYIIVVAFYMVSQGPKPHHIRSWNNFADIVALALNSPAGADMKNTSAGVETLGVLGLNTIFRAHNGAIEMMVGRKQTSLRAPDENLEAGFPYG